MIDKAPGKDFHSEIDEAIDNLFTPFAGLGQDTPAADAGAAAKAGPAPEERAPSAAVPPGAAAASATASEPPREFTAFEEALLSLEWEISASNIDKCRAALQEIQNNFDLDKAIAMTEVFALMDRILEVMSVAPQNVPTSAPKTLKEGLHTLLAVTQAADLSLLEQTLIDPTLSELRSAVPNIPRDYSKLAQPAAAKAQAKPAAPAVKTPPKPRPAPASDTKPEAEDPGLELPAAAVSGKAPAGLGEAVNAHITVLGKCIEKRIIPIENLFAKTPGYEKLHAIHTELRERLEKEKQILISALAGDYRPGSQPPAESLPDAATAPRACPWQTLATATWDGKTIAFVPEQIAYEATPAKKQAGPFYALGNLKKGFFGKIGLAVRGALRQYDEATLRTMSVPVAALPSRADTTLLIAFKDKCGMAFWLEGPSEEIDVPANAPWTAGQDPDSLFAGQLQINGRNISVITLRSV
ncbi:hypothetical protein ACUUL3_10035 [Thiovibrio sp. JS02]